MSCLRLEHLALKWIVTETIFWETNFVVLMDNNPLKYLSTAQLGAYEQKWAVQLPDIDFEIKYRPGKLNTNADLFSRLSSDKVDILSECIH